MINFIPEVMRFIPPQSHRPDPHSRLNVPPIDLELTFTQRLN